MQTDAAPTLDQVNERVGRLKGVAIRAEMVRPSSVAMAFKIAPGGRLWARYPTSEMFVTPTERVTWMPERREYAREKPEPDNPLPAGFEALWPGGARLTGEGTARRATFAGKPAWELPCRAAAGHAVSLYVDPASLLPVGSVATSQGTTFEVRYLAVEERVVAGAELTFVPPPGARPAGGAPERSRLLTVGARLPAFRGNDLDGRPLTWPASTGSGRGLVVNFWFSACTGCVREMPFLARLDPTLRERGIRLVGVNPIDPVRDARRTCAANGLKFPTLTGAAAKRLADAVGVTAYPVTVVAHPRGVVADAILGFDEARLRAALRALDTPKRRS